MSYLKNDQTEKVYKSANERLHKLFDDLHQLDQRFSYDDDLGYIRFHTSTGRNEFIVSWTYTGMALRLRPGYGTDGVIEDFNYLYSNYDETRREFFWLYPETHSLKPNWEEDLEFECKLIYDSMVDALKKEAEMKRKIKIWEIRRAANVFC
jgi:hypothetical protein